MNNVHNDFIGFGRSPVDSSSRMLKGCPYGGVACLWSRGKRWDVIYLLSLIL